MRVMQGEVLGLTSNEARPQVRSLARSAPSSCNGRTGRTISYFCSSNFSTNWTSEILLETQKSMAAVELRKSIASVLMRTQERCPGSKDRSLFAEEGFAYGLSVHSGTCLLLPFNSI